MHERLNKESLPQMCNYWRGRCEYLRFLTDQVEYKGCGGIVKPEKCVVLNPDLREHILREPPKPGKFSITIYLVNVERMTRQLPQRN